MINPTSLALRCLMGILGAITLPGCGGSSTETLSVTTYNVALPRGQVPLAQERIAVNQTLLQQLKSDVTCFQELWLPEDREMASQAVSAKQPFSYSIATQQSFSDTAQCSEDGIAAFKTCALTNCAGAPLDSQTQCVLSNCQTEFLALDSTCQGAIIAQAGNDLEDGFEAVVEPSPLFVFEGATGIMLTSKYELNDVFELDMSDISTSINRAAIFATIEVSGYEHVIGCAHLTADLGEETPYTGQYISWENEQRLQAERLIATAENLAGDRPIYLAGDFNCSIENTELGTDGDFEENCELYRDAGYNDPAADRINCSYCTREDSEDLNLTQSYNGFNDFGNLLLDHVFTMNEHFNRNIIVERLFDETVEVEDDGEIVTIHPSDHYAIRITIPVKDR